MAEMFIKYILTRLVFTFVISCYFESRVLCDDSRNVDSELRRSRRNVIELYDAHPNHEVFEYIEEPDSNRIPDIKYVTGSSSDGNKNSVDSFPIRLAPTLCRELQTELAKNAGGFVQCAIINARPVTICLNCVVAYNATMVSYQSLMETSENDTRCKDVLTGKDKLEIIETMYGSILNMWNQGNCNSCYETDASGSPNFSVVSNQTLNFMQTLKKVIDCFESIKSLENLGGSSNGTCVECKLLYKGLGKIYDSILDDMTDKQIGMCADVTDAMNVTHHIWNNQLKCELFDTNVGYALFVLTGSLSAIPVLFYLAAKILSNVETIHLVLPKRKQFVQDSTRMQM